MADEINDKMEQFKELLNNENMAENIKMLMNMLSSNNQKPNVENQKTPQHDEKSPTAAKEMPAVSNKNSNISMDMEKMETMMKIKKVYDRINDTNDPGVNLLMALKPFLNEKRKAKLDNAVKLVGFSKIPSIIRELDKE